MDQNIPKEIYSFLESLLQDAGMTALDAEMKKEMINELYARLENYLTSVIIDTMPEEHLDAFVKLNEEKKPQEEVQKFIQDNLPDAQDVFTKAFADFRELYLGNVTAARNAPEKDIDKGEPN